MEEQISNRHEGDLGGRFLPFGDTSKVEITVVVAAEVAHLPAVQHTAWMLLNLLARQQGVIQAIQLVCPPGIALAGRIVPLAPRTVDFRQALLTGCAAIECVPVSLNPVQGRVLVVGPSTNSAGELYLYADGWHGGITAKPAHVVDYQSSLPFGPYIAACLAAAEVFKAARLKPEHHQPISEVYFSAWSLQTTSNIGLDGPHTISIAPHFGLAGVGAVGSTFLHALWACEGFQGRALIADNDEKHLDRTNLNRYPLFGNTSIGEPKATEAARLIADCTCQIEPHNSSIQDLSELPPFIVSAVDRNYSRLAIQNRYPPRVISGSTKDLRAEILRCGPPTIGACLRCHNPPESATSDDEIRAQLRNLPDEALQAHAKTAGISVDDLQQWAQTGKCGMAGERVLSHLRRLTGDPPEFSVGFVSVMAGTLLAAQTAKEFLCTSEPLSGRLNRAVFQFWTPNAITNKATFLARDPNCPMCRPNTPAAEVWGRRFSQFACVNP